MLGCIAAIIALLVIAAISWAITCGIIYLITICFSLAFSWPIATGIWLVLILLRSVFSDNHNSKK